MTGRDPGPIMSDDLERTMREAVRRAFPGFWSPRRARRRDSITVCAEVARAAIARRTASPEITSLQRRMDDALFQLVANADQRAAYARACAEVAALHTGVAHPHSPTDGCPECEAAPPFRGRHHE